MKTPSRLQSWLARAALGAWLGCSGAAFARQDAGIDAATPAGPRLSSSAFGTVG